MTEAAQEAFSGTGGPGTARPQGGTFSGRAHDKLHDAKVQRAMRNFNLAAARSRAMAELPELEDIRTAAAAIRDTALADLDVWLERFETEATRRGVKVHWAETHADVNRIVAAIAREAGVRKVIKSKSMVSEESHLNAALEAEGLEVVETDLGEYIIQLAGETPSHIIAPAIHKTREDVADLFHQHHGTPRKTGIPELTMEARAVLRGHFLSGDMGISGGNFLVAETGSVVLVDAGRSTVLGSDMREALRCIRCGACMNHCPVYQNIGGHAYGWVYPGPIGSVLTPSYIGLENAVDLPNAATLCNQCGVVCPVRIPLPDLMRKLREKQVEAGLRPRWERAGLRVWSWFAQRPALYALATRLAARVGRLLGGKRRAIGRLPGGGWTGERDFPAPQGRTFRELYARRPR